MKIRPKILLMFFSLAFLVGAPLLLTVKNAMHTILLQAIAKRSVLYARDMSDETKVGFLSRSEQTLLPLLQVGQENADAIYVAALGPTGEVLAHTNVAEKGKIYSDRVTVAEMVTDEPWTEIGFINGSPVIFASAPVWRDESAAATDSFLLAGVQKAPDRVRLGTISLCLPLAEVYSTQYILFRKIATLVLIAGGIAFSIILIFMRHLLLPIQYLSEGTSRVSRGEYGGTVPVLSGDELGSLAKDFNHMNRVLAETTVSKNFLGDILSNMIDPLIVMAMDGTIRMVNQAALTLLGYSREELEGAPAVLLFVGHEHVTPDMTKEMIMSRSAVRNLEVVFVTKAGEKIPMLFSSSTLKDEQGQSTGIIAMAKDMTERKKLEVAVRQSEKLSAVGQLAAGVAHEINNPLGVILGFAQAAVRRLKPDDELGMALRSIEKEAVRCKNLVQDLLTFSRVSKIDREPLDLNHAIESAFSLVSAQARLTHVTIKKNLAPNLPRVLGNVNQIQQVIINLANNAMDAMDKAQGVLTVTTEALTEDHLSWVVLKVSDTGSGIPPEIQSRVFDPFFTTKAVGKGTGLGLSLVHEIIKKHSGSIDLRSQPGATEFCIKFPARLPQQTPVIASQEAA